MQQSTAWPPDCSNMTLTDSPVPTLTTQTCHYACDSIIRRLVVLIATEATLMAESQAARRQAESATVAAQQMLDEKDNKKNDVRIQKILYVQ